MFLKAIGILDQHFWKVKICMDQIVLVSMCQADRNLRDIVQKELQIVERDFG